MSITFGGLATGLDTNAIVEQLMALERTPINRLQADKTWFQNRQTAYAAFDSKLKGFLSSIEKLGSNDDLRQKTVTAANDDFFSVSAGVAALPGTSYQVEVVSLAQVQKMVTQGYVDKNAATFGFGELTLNVGGNEPITITIDGTNNSLEGVMAAINAADAGVSAAIINDGTDSPYRLVLAGNEPATSFTLISDLPTYNGDVSSQLQSGGFASVDTAYFGSGTLDLSTGQQITLANAGNSLTDIMDAINAQTATTGVTAAIVAEGNNFVLALDNGASIAATNLAGGYADPLNLTETQAASRAHIRVDNIDIYSDSNILDEAIPGVTLDLLQAEAGTTTNISVALDEKAIKGQIQKFVTGYNDILSFIGGQSAKEGSKGGILGGNSGMNTVKRRLQGLLTTAISNSGSFAAMSQLGMKTQRDGTIQLDDAVLTNAIKNDLDSVAKLMVGEGEAQGIAVRFQDYLKGMTHSNDGLYAANKKSTETTVKKIDSRIEQIEMRLEKKQETMRNKFAALENLISSMNSQSNFLTQQMDLLNNMMTRKR